jgi:hypothetical protein
MTSSPARTQASARSLPRRSGLPSSPRALASRAVQRGRLVAGRIVSPPCHQSVGPDSGIRSSSIAWFTIWMLFVETKPWPMLTLVVSLEAIFLSTFVMIGQNRQAEFQQAKADHDFTEQALELKTNTELTREIDKLTTELHSRLLGKTAQ